MSKLSLLVILSAISIHTHAESFPGEVKTVDMATETATSSLPVEASPVLDLNAFSTMEQIIPALAEKRVVFIGEQHTRYDHHLTQLEIIRRLHALHPQLAIGMEMFQQPFQQHLDEYVAGSIDEKAMLRATEYYRRWRMDYRYYAPILRYAREHRLPVIALNIPSELTHEVAHVGLDGLNDEDRKQLPADIAPADEAYRQRLKKVFDHHPKEEGHDDFEHFLEAQLLWDESMAERAAAFLEEHPDHHLVVIAGNQHLAWGSAIPQRLQRRTAVTTASILNSWDGIVKPGLADFLLLPEEQPLPPAGKLGVVLKDDKGQTIIAVVFKNGACAEVDIKAGERITAIDNNAINSITDLRMALWDKLPGDTIHMDTTRKRLLMPDKNLSYEITLH
ncbi:MAG: ChaN family lipoprotein [Pseudomonadota bacterium]